MANRWLFAGGDVGVLRRTGTQSVETSGSLRNSSWSDHSLRSNAVASTITADFLNASGASDSATSGETVWCHVEMYVGATSATAGNLVIMVDGSDQPWLALRNVSAGTWGLYYNSGSGGSPTWTLIGSTFAAASSSVVSGIDLKLTLGSPHDAEVFVAGVSKPSGNFTQASLTAIDAFQTNCFSSGFTLTYSEWMASVGFPTVGGHVYYGKPSAAGSNSGWTGAYTTIDDVGIDDADLISSGSAGQKSTFAYANLPTLTAGLAVGDLFMWTRAKNDGASPTNVKPVRRDSGATDNVGTSFSGIGAGFADFLTRYSGITESEYNASEFGVESAA
jgi:hypothetical protein